MLTNEGAVRFGVELLQGVTQPTLYVGVCNQVPDVGDLLPDITTEPTAAGGYSRIALARNSTDWPNFYLLNGEIVWRSKVITFAASGADFSRAFTRLFITDAAAGTSGRLYAYSGASASDILLLDGQSQATKFEFYP